MEGTINFSGILGGSIADGGDGNVQDVQTNASGDYESVVDEQGIAKIDFSNYTTDEQLESAIDNVNTVLLTKQNIVNYSTEEQNTGIKWIDEKPIFQKTFEKTINITSTSRVWHTIITSSELREIEADKIFLDSSGTYIEDSEAIYSVNYSTIVGTVGGVICAIYDKTSDEIQLLVSGFNAGNKNIKITIRYTKGV